MDFDGRTPAASGKNGSGNNGKNGRHVAAAKQPVATPSAGCGIAACQDAAPSVERAPARGRDAGRVAERVARGSAGRFPGTPVGGQRARRCHRLADAGHRARVQRDHFAQRGDGQRDGARRARRRSRRPHDRTRDSAASMQRRLGEASVGSINALIGDLVQPTTEVARVISAVADGDFTQKMALQIEGQPVKGEFLRIGTTVNTMVDQLSSFAAEVTRVAQGGRHRRQARRSGRGARRRRHLARSDRQREPAGEQPHRAGAQHRRGDDRRSRRATCRRRSPSTRAARCSS